MTAVETYTDDLPWLKLMGLPRAIVLHVVRVHNRGCDHVAYSWLADGDGSYHADKVMCPTCKAKSA